MDEHVDQAVWALITCLQTGDEELKTEAAMTLAECGPKAAPAVPALRAVEREEDPELRAQATLAIARIRPELAAASPG